MKNADCVKNSRDLQAGASSGWTTPNQSPITFFSPAGWNKLLTVDPAEPEFPMEPSALPELC